MKSFGFRLLSASAALIVLANCGEDAKNPVDETPSLSGNEWMGEESVFAQEFEIREKDGNRLLYLKGKTEPFTGNLQRQKLDGGLWKERYQAGLKHGLQLKRSANGARVEASFEEGVLHGDVVMFDRHEGEVSRMHYVRGTLARLLPAADGNSTKVE